MASICFVDTETTSLRPDRRAWDIALILREPERPDVEHTWYVEAEDLDLGNADPFSLRIGHFYDRHPQFRTDGGDYDEAWGEARALASVEEVTRGAHLVGSVPNFDAEVFGTRMRAHGLLPAWHYHLVDVETLAVGQLAARGEALSLPWNSEDLSRRLGVDPPAADARHTAIGDARWARNIFDAVMGVRT